VNFEHSISRENEVSIGSLQGEENLSPQDLCKEKKTSHLADALISRLKIYCASPSSSGKRRATRRTEEVGGYELP
jgi:hypothetical protein